MKVAFSGLIVLMALAGCGNRTRQFPSLGSVTSIIVSGHDRSKPLAKIIDERAISEIVFFVDAHRDGWDTPWFGIPVPVVTAEFYDGAKFKGSFGVGQNFIEVQRDGGFFSQNVPAGEVRRFLDLVGVSPSAVQKLTK
jgi:hypothetical protein